MAGRWDRVPSVVLHEIYSLLGTEDKLRASATCRGWRQVFYASFVPTAITFRVRSGDQNGCERSLFLASCWGNRLRNAVLEFDSTDASAAERVADVLHALCANCHLRRLTLRPSHCIMEAPPQPAFIDRRIIGPLRAVIENSKQLQVLNLGGLEDLAPYFSELLQLLATCQSKGLQQLHLTTLKSYPQDYEIFDLEPSHFASLHALQHLSLDYDNVTDDLLQALSAQGRDLRCFNIFVHGVDEDHIAPTNQTWAKFTKQNAKCELRMSLLFSSDAVDFLSAGLLLPEMPLSQLKVLFCEKMNMDALHILYDFYPEQLSVLWWVDITSSNEYATLDRYNGPHPLVMVAWRCLKLKELVFIGYDQLDQNIIAISRLRGPELKRLDVPESNIFYDEVTIGTGNNAKAEFIDEVSDSLMRTWAPLSCQDMPQVLLSPTLESAIEFALNSVQPY